MCTIHSDTLKSHWEVQTALQHLRDSPLANEQVASNLPWLGLLWADWREVSKFAACVKIVKADTASIRWFFLSQSVLWRRFYWYIEFKVIREKLKYDAGEPCWQPTKASSANRSIGGFSEFCRLFLNSFVTASDSPGSMWYQDVSGTWLRVNQLPLGFSYLTIRFWEESAKDATDAVLLAEIPGRGKGYLAKRKIKRGEASPVEWVTGCHCSSELDPDIWILSKSF